MRLPSKGKLSLSHRWYVYQGWGSVRNRKL
jgi:hypothetical protein